MFNVLNITLKSDIDLQRVFRSTNADDFFFASFNIFLLSDDTAINLVIFKILKNQL